LVSMESPCTTSY